MAVYALDSTAVLWPLQKKFSLFVHLLTHNVIIMGPYSLEDDIVLCSVRLQENGLLYFHMLYFQLKCSVSYIDLNTRML